MSKILPRRKSDCFPFDALRTSAGGSTMSVCKTTEVGCIGMLLDAKGVPILVIWSRACVRHCSRPCTNRLPAASQPHHHIVNRSRALLRTSKEPHPPLHTLQNSNHFPRTTSPWRTLPRNPSPAAASSSCC
ncbi:hypothetical protein IG631_20394 [Alternaria alternata]|nr:hypothetical protein IG631_20394 [Alternaria alternata]